MIATHHLLQPGGWRMTFRESRHKVCSELLPEPGTTILIGHAGKGNGCRAVWMTGEGLLRTISIAPKEDHWEARVKYQGRFYVITIGKNPKPGAGGRPAIGGMVKAVNSLASVRRPPDGYEAQGAWSAEANPGG